jgi:hypothetical protein
MIKIIYLRREFANRIPWQEQGLRTKNHKMMYQPEMQDYNKYVGKRQFPFNGQMCEEAV